MNKKALVIGINYKNTSNELNGCINDALSMKQFLIDICGYQDNNITLLTDDADVKPTAVNILDSLANLIIDARNGIINEMFVSYSGHGTYIVDTDGDEKDNRDEAIVPLDYTESGIILDDLLHDYIEYIPDNTNCILLFDACNSGTMLDLRFRYINHHKNVIENKESKLKSNILVISGCRDDQTSSDAFLNGKWAGAMTQSFLGTLKKFNYDITCHNLLREMRKYLSKRGFEQMPQLSTNKPLSNTTVFMAKNNVVDIFMQKK